MYLRFWDEDRDVWELLDKEFPRYSLKTHIKIFINDIKAYYKKFRKKVKKMKEPCRVAQFSKVSIEQFMKDYLALYPEATLSEIGVAEEIYEKIKLPERATPRSAGYDLYAPFDIDLPFGQSIIIPTGIRCYIEDPWFFDINPRSGQGFKYGIKLANTRGIIDNDYYDTDCEGHIMAKIVNNDDAVNTEKKPFQVEAGKAYAQGIFMFYGITFDDAAKGIRKGGLGSTDKK